MNSLKTVAAVTVLFHYKSSLPGPPFLLNPTVADDHQALIWDIQQMPRAIEDPILAYTAEGEINNVQWASTQPDWIAICYNNCLEILRV